ncbi:unnamed protein product [Gadus morhua 'NCC']
MDEEREEGGPTSKTTLSGEHGRRSKAKSPEKQERTDPPGPSCVSMKSGWSMDPPVSFKDGNQSIKKRRVQQERADSPGPSCVSMKSGWSMDVPVTFKDGRPSSEESPEQQQRTDSPGPSCVSMKSDHSMDIPFRKAHLVKQLVSEETRSASTGGSGGRLDQNPSRPKRAMYVTSRKRNRWIPQHPGQQRERDPREPVAQQRE